MPIARRANAFARCSGGSIARSAKGASQAPSASRRSIPFGGTEKGTGAPGAGKEYGQRSVAFYPSPLRGGSAEKHRTK